MRKLFLPILAGALLTACIDKDYDLENVDTDNIAIGGDDSKFEVPLARVLVTLEDIANGDLNILELCEKADKWLPSKLPGNADFVDLVLLSRNSYTAFRRPRRRNAVERSQTRCDDRHDVDRLPP